LQENVAGYYVAGWPSETENGMPLEKMTSFSEDRCNEKMSSYSEDRCNEKMSSFSGYKCNEKMSSN